MNAALFVPGIEAEMILYSMKLIIIRVYQKYFVFY